MWQRDFLRHTPQLLTAWWRRSLLGWKRAPPKPPSLVCFCWKVCLIGHRRVEFELFGFLEWAILRLCPAAGVSERRVLWEGEWSYWGYEVGWEFHEFLYISFASVQGHDQYCWCFVRTLIEAKLLEVDWLRERTFFLNHKGTFVNQEGMINWS